MGGEGEDSLNFFEIDKGKDMLDQPRRKSSPPGGTGDTDEEDISDAELVAEGSTGEFLRNSMKDVDSMNHWEFYASRKKIPFVTLADYGPKNAFLHYLWSGMVVLGLRFVLPRLDRRFDCSYVWDYWWRFLAWFTVMGIGLSPYLDGTMKASTCITMMAVTWFIYYILFFGLLSMRQSINTRFSDRATMLKCWEHALWTSWFGMVMCYVVLNKAAAAIKQKEKTQ
ncbi:unnamed protein product [Amoebophrya sp. A25]|nr:unnamed protein product [Amoebophrya sp. A25]|eukprot:GSA25T00010345001.1